MLEHALQYAARGWPVFPLTGFKTPFKGSHGHLDATTDAATIERWWNQRPQANIGLACGAIVVLDADGPGALARLAEIAAPHGGLPRTLTARTARGFHFYFAAPAGIEIRTRNEPRKAKGDDGIDIKGHGGFVVLPPSINRKNNFEYQWVGQQPLCEMPAWLVAWCQGRASGEQKGNSVLSPAQLPAYIRERVEANRGQKQTLIGERLERALKDPWSPELEARIKSALRAIPATGYDRWREVGMALHSLQWETPDGDRGMALFDAWSATAPEQYSPAETERKWASFGRRRGISIGTLFHLAEQCGWQGYNPEPSEPGIPGAGKEVMPVEPSVAHFNARPETPPPLAFFASPEGAQVPHANGHHVDLSALDGDGNQPLIQLNRDYCVIGDIGGKCLVLGWVPSKVDERVQVPSFQTFKSFAERFAHKRVKVLVKKDDGAEHESKPLGTEWLKWKHRKTFQGIDMAPGQPQELPNDMLNLWRGFSVKPAQGTWGLMKRHIVEVLAGGSVEAAQYIVRWAAWTVQNPGERAEVALVFRGAKGTGKGTFARALRDIFGQHGLQIFNPKHLVGSFNGHLRNCLLLYADEAFWAGDKQGESVLKGMLTEPTLIIEQKGVDAMQWRNRLHVIMTANADWVVPASHDERRYCVFDVNDRYAVNEKYFNPLHAELANGGLSAMLHDLQAMDLQGWHPRKIVNTEALRAQKERSMPPIYEWYEALLQDGVLPYASKDAPDICSAAYMVQLIRDGIPRLRDLTATALGRFLAQQGAIKIHRSNGNVWRFPPLPEARRQWEARFNGWRWDVALERWETR